MNRISILNKFVGKPLKPHLKILACTYSTKEAVQIQEDVAQDLSQYERLTKIAPRIRKKLPQRPPFAKNLFLGVFDTEILTYPELESEELKELNENIEPVNNCFKNLSPQMFQQAYLSKDFMDILKHLKLFGLQCSQFENGRELCLMETCRFNELLYSDSSTAPGLLTNEHLGIQILRKNGNEEQKKKYLSDLIKGNILSAVCIDESQLKDLVTFDTTATMTEDKNSWILNGKKCAVINGSTATLFIVIARTTTLNKMGFHPPKHTAFLVEKDFAGITIQPCNKLGLEGTDVCDVIFHNTCIPEDNILGSVNGADTLVTSLFTEFRLSSGSACSVLITKLLNNLVNYCKDTNMATIPITEADYVRSVIAQITLSLYAVESITYLTAGLLDQYEGQDCLLESNIVKVFSAEEACSSALKCMDILGTSAYMKDHWCNTLYRDALSYRYLNETSENLKNGIALLGLQHAGQTIQEQITKIRNPLFYANEMFKRMWTTRKHARDDPPLNLRLGDYLHPSLCNISTFLEYCVVRLQYATDVLLARHGAEIVNQHMELRKLGECAIAIYAMTACLGRASRSYCIGLENANYEMNIANAFCLNAMQEVKDKVNKLCVGPYSTCDESYRNIAKRVFKCGKYFPQHPLTRNY